MRALAPALALLVVLTGAARADEEPDPDGDYAAFPRRSYAIGFQIHGTRVDGRSESGVGPSVEAALGRGRWQYLVEAALSDTNRDPTMSSGGSDDMRVDGRLWRGGLGARWLARQFRPDSSGGVELFLHSLVGAQRYRYDDGVKTTRPEVSLGFGIQVRGYNKPRFAFRIDMRVLFTARTEDSTGFLTGLTLAW